MTRKCPNGRSSRRLPKARVFIANMVQEILDMARSITLAECEGVQWLFSGMTVGQRSTVQQMTIEFKHLETAPWRVSEPSDPEQAQICVNQLTSRDESQMTPSELKYKRELLPSLQVAIEIEIEVGKLSGAPSPLTWVRRIA